MDDEGQDELPAPGRSFLVVDLDVGEPLGVHQRLDIGVDLLHVERLADPAQQLGPDLLGWIVAFPSKRISEMFLRRLEDRPAFRRWVELQPASGRWTGVAARGRVSPGRVSALPDRGSTPGFSRDSDSRRSFRNRLATSSWTSGVCRMIRLMLRKKGVIDPTDFDCASFSPRSPRS